MVVGFESNASLAQSSGCLFHCYPWPLPRLFNQEGAAGPAALLFCYQLLETPLASWSCPWESPLYNFSCLHSLSISLSLSAPPPQTLETRVKVRNGEFDIRADVLLWSTLSTQNNRFSRAVTPNKECSHIPREMSSARRSQKRREHLSAYISTCAGPIENGGWS